MEDLRTNQKDGFFEEEKLAECNKKLATLDLEIGLTQNIYENLLEVKKPEYIENIS